MQPQKPLSSPPTKTLNDYTSLIETVARVEYNRISASHLVEYSELVNIAATAVHVVLTSHKGYEYNISYISTAVKWAIRNELRRRYRWYSHKQKVKEDNSMGEETEYTEDLTDIKQEDVREAIYETILSIDDLAEGENPTQIKDSSLTPEESYEFGELSKAIRKAITHLPPREKQILESRFFKGKKIREVADEFKISPSRATRIIQSGLDKVKIELQRQELV